MTKVEDMLSKSEVETIRPGHALRNFSKNKIKINKEKLKVTRSWQSCPIHPHCNDPLKRNSVRSTRTDR